VKTRQERIDHLADRIRNFEIAVSGGSDLLGGFGKIPDDAVTVEHLEAAFKKFRLTGTNGLQAAGSIEKGYALYGGPAIAAGVEGFPANLPPPPIVGCGTPTLVVSGVTVNTACQSAPWGCSGGGSYQLVDTGFNSTGVLTDAGPILGDWCDGYDPADCIYLYDVGDLESHTYTSPLHYDCSGTPNFTYNYHAQGVVAFIAGVWYVWIYNYFDGPANQFSDFFFGSSASPSSIANALTGFDAPCSPTVRSSALMDVYFGDCTPGSGDYLLAAQGAGGTVSITP